MSQQIDFDPNVDYYKALGVGEKAPAEEIKRAYRKLAKQFHPDTTGGDKAKESRFKDIQNAYDVLGDAKKRGLYDQIRTGGGMPGGGYTYQARGAGGAGGPSLFDLGDLFSQFFANSKAARGGARVHVDQVDFDDDRRQPHDAEFVSKVKAADGTWLRVEGIDVFSDLRISFDRAILGTVAPVGTIEGKADVKVPPGTSSGKKLRLRGKGVTDRSGRVGDHYVTIQIDVPGDLDEEAKKQLVQLVTRLRKRGHHD